MDPLKRSFETSEAPPNAKKKADPAFERIASCALERFVKTGILTQEQRVSYVSQIKNLLQGRATLPEEGHQKWYAQTLSGVIEMLQKTSLGQWRVFSKPLPESLDEDRFERLKRELIYEYSMHIRKMLHECAEANLDDHEIVESGLKESLLPVCVKPRNPKRSATLPQILVPLHHFFHKRRWLFEEDQQIMDDIERVLLHVWKKEHPVLSDTEGMRAIPLCNQIWQLMHREDFSGYTNEWKKQAVLRLKDLCKALSQVDFNTHHLRASADSSKPLVVREGAELNPRPLAGHLRSWMHENGVSGVFQDAPGYPALIGTLYQRARSLMEGRRLHEELLVCKDLWNLKAPLDVACEVTFLDGSCAIPAHQALVMSKAAALFKQAITRRAQIPLTKTAFETLYAALIHEWPQQDSDSILTAFKPARLCQMGQLMGRLFRDLKFCLARCSRLQELMDLENKIQRLDCFDAAWRTQWQKERDGWISEWLNNPFDLEDKPPKVLLSVRSIRAEGVLSKTWALMAQMAELEQLETDALADLSQLDAKAFNNLQSLTLTAPDPDLAILKQWLARPSLNKLTVTLQSAESLEPFLKIVPASIALHARIAKECSSPISLPCPNLTSLDITCAEIFQELIAIPELKLRLVGQHANEAALHKLRQVSSVRLLELRGSWGLHRGIWEILRHLSKLEILCLGRSGSKNLIATEFKLQSIPHLNALELLVTSEVIAVLPRLLATPVRDLTIRLHDESSQEITLLNPLFKEKLHVIGSCKIDLFGCTEFYVLKKEEKAVFFLSGHHDDKENQLVNGVIAPAFPTISHITLRWEDDFSRWVAGKDGNFDKIDEKPAKKESSKA